MMLQRKNDMFWRYLNVSPENGVKNESKNRYF